MNLKSLKSEINNQKGQFFKGKITKSSITFIENKPNSKNIKIGVSFFKTSKYENLIAWRRKKQTQNKANSNPITEKPKMCLRNTIQMNYKDFAPVASKNQTRFKAKQTQILIKFISSCYTKTLAENDGNEVDIYSILCNYIKQLIWFFNLRDGLEPNFSLASRITPKPARIRKENL